MSAPVETGLTSAFGGASVLLQAQLGTGLVLTCFGAAVSKSADLRKQLEGCRWEQAVATAASSVSSGSLLATHALIQVKGANSDILTNSGLGICTLASLGSLIAQTTGGGKATKACEGIKGVGMALLLFSQLPSGIELLTASAFIRAVLGCQSVLALSSACSKGACNVCSTLAEVDPLLSLAPIIGALALLSNIAHGPASILMLPFQASLPCLALLALLLALRLALGASSVESTAKYALDFKVEGSGVATSFQKLVSAIVSGILLLMALSLAWAGCGIFKFSLSTTGLTLQWGDLLVAAAASVMLLLIGTHVGGFAFGKIAPEAQEPESSPINGIEVSNGAVTAFGGKSLGLMNFMATIVTPTEPIALSMLAMRLSDEESESGILFLPFKYGFVLALAGVVMQVVSLFMFFAAAAGAPPTFDATGTVLWEGKEAEPKILSTLRSLIFLCLSAGLFLGCLGLGFFTFAANFAAVAVALMVLAPPSTREKVLQVGSIVLGVLFSSLDAFLQAQRAARAAAESARAAAAAKALEETEQKAAAKMGPAKSTASTSDKKKSATSKKKSR
mmetsp:Transcript_72379/g.151043  ORF Transcript_72379/g.151043 Transcript_72379/m.151043 type:complete len:564 (+) Transcript_72379:113-1804(+)